MVGSNNCSPVVLRAGPYGNSVSALAARIHADILSLGWDETEKADAVFYITRGKVKVPSFRTEGKEAIVALWDLMNLSVKDVWSARRDGWRQRLQ
jgi:hypothetical protein